MYDVFYDYNKKKDNLIIMRVQTVLTARQRRRLTDRPTFKQSQAYVSISR